MLHQQNCEKLFGLIQSLLVPRVNPLPKQDREIAARIRKFRRESKCSRSYLADRVGVTPGIITRIELGRIPLKYDVAVTIFSELGINPFWAATGDGVPKQKLHLPDITYLKLPKNSLFSEVFFKEILPMFKREGPDPQSEIVLRYQLGHGNANLVKLWFTHFVPDGKVRELDKKLNEVWAPFGKLAWVEDPKRRLQRDIWYSQLVESIKAKIAAETEKAKNSKLTNVSSHANLESVNQWQALKRRIRKVAAGPGEKSALTKYLGVELTQLSRWLSDSDSAPEPGADKALKMLLWVQKREGQ